MLTLEERHRVIDRLDENHIRDLARKARVHLRNRNTVELCYQPGDATWYPLILTHRDDVIGAPGGGGAGEANSYLSTTGEVVIVVLANQGTATWYQPGLDDPYWVAGKLIDNNASATAIGCLLEQIFGFSGD